MILTSFFVIIYCFYNIVSCNQDNYYLKNNQLDQFYKNQLKNFDQINDKQLPNENLDKEQPQSCYDFTGSAQRCEPPFENAAYQKPIFASNTCGMNGPNKYCKQVFLHQQEKEELFCTTCLEGQHRVEFMIDNRTDTWWQSETQFEKIEYPKEVNITLNLGKAFDITFIKLRFNSPRPESFALFKKKNFDSEWTPFQYYSATCNSTYNKSNSNEAPSYDETEALCTNEYSDISPLDGGDVIFQTLFGRPSARDIHKVKELQDFVTATDIKIVLKRHNTFGDEIFGEDNILRSYYYAIDTLIVGARCKCNGHANECIASDQANRLVCRCEHNTNGTECDRCMDFFNDVPWAVATAENANECKPCNCNGRSIKCFFDQDLYIRTGYGGHCIDCIDNTDGPNCESCKENHYKTVDGRCVACNCDSIGSINLQCDGEGRCLCKTGIDGLKCNRCMANYYDFSIQGCKPCNCNRLGSFNNTETCNAVTGQCLCKENVESKQCNQCKLGYFDLDFDNDQGCLPCFCYGHSHNCQSSNYKTYLIESQFLEGNEKWLAFTKKNNDLNYRQYSQSYFFDNYQKNSDNQTEVQHATAEELIFVSSKSNEIIYFDAPEKFLGDQRFSYNQFLTFELKIDQNKPKATHEDIIIQGKNFTIFQPIFGQNNPLPSTKLQTYKFRLQEGINNGWTPKLNSMQFMTLLANITSIFIRATYTYKGIGYLSSFKLESAISDSSSNLNLAHWVENCICQTGYIGQFCESCDANYYHEPSFEGAFASCKPCQCNGNADYCDPETGKCGCKNNTGGKHCERCASGYYSKNGTKNCQPCLCPDNGACVVLQNEEIACLNCPVGYAGFKCDVCTDGYYGDPQGKNGNKTECKLCECNDNIDLNAIGNCDSITGECLKCIYNTYGFNCDKCLKGYFGNPFTLPKGDCKPCQCHVDGTLEISGINYKTKSCDPVTGQCNCKSYVWNRQCSQCMPDYYNISNPEGCITCDCDLIGSYNRTCDQITGQCHCKPGVTGLTCNKCLPYHYGFSLKGCQPCNCDIIGTISSQCDESGQCPCKENIEGKRCERCRENKYNREKGCLNCPPCYNLIQDQVILHRRRLGELVEILDNIERNPKISQDYLFEKQLNKVTAVVSNLQKDTEINLGSHKNLVSNYTELQKNLIKLKKSQIELIFMQNLNQNIKFIKNNITSADKYIAKSKKLLSEARKLLEEDGKRALEDARERTTGEYVQQSRKMGEIAREARLQSEKNQIVADEIEFLMKQISNVSMNAKKLSEQALKVQLDNQNAIEQLRKQFSIAYDTLEKTRRMAQDAKIQANRAYNSSLDIKAKSSSITINQFNVSAIKQNALDVHNNANEINNQVKKIIERYEAALNQSETKLEDARKLLNEANEQQNLLSILQLNANKSLEQAEVAKKNSEQIHFDAINTLDTLKRFNEQITRSKAEAEKSLKKVSVIKLKIEEVEQRTKDMSVTLQSELQLAKDAEEVANQAQINANNSFTNALAMVNKAKKRIEESKNVNQKVKELGEKVEETSKDIEDSEQQTNKDSELAKEALKKANQAKIKANETSKKINENLNILENILSELNNLDNFDSTHFNELEFKLKLAQKDIVQADFNSRIAAIKQSREHQKNWLINYEKEIKRLNQDVENINQINLAIPFSKCYGDPSLEP